MFKFSYLSYFLSENQINMNLCFYQKDLTDNKRYLDRSSLTTKPIVNIMIFVIIKKLIFSKAMGAWWNW